MADVKAAMRAALSCGDIGTLRQLWAASRPGMPQPASDEEAEVAMHMARTAARHIPLAQRLYSHSWLDERGLPSRLPDRLRPPAQRVHPVLVSAVGIAVAGKRSANPERAERARALERFMSDAVAEMYAAGITDDARIAARMWQARAEFVERERRTWLRKRARATGQGPLAVDRVEAFGGPI